MKTSINKLCIAASILVTAAGISACVDDNKTLHDPEYKTPNPCLLYTSDSADE